MRPREAAFCASEAVCSFPRPGSWIRGSPKLHWYNENGFALLLSEFVIRACVGLVMGGNDKTVVFVRNLGSRLFIDDVRIEGAMDDITVGTLGAEQKSA